MNGSLVWHGSLEGVVREAWQRERKIKPYPKKEK
jgi:hypothetical protein